MEKLPVLRPFVSCNDEDERVAVGLGPSCCTSIALVQGALEQRLQGFPDDRDDWFSKFSFCCFDIGQVQRCFGCQLGNCRRCDVIEVELEASVRGDLDG